MAAPHPLAEMIELVAPRLDAALISRDNIDRIIALSRDVPHWQCAGFECRLGEADPGADFGIHVRRRDGLAGPAASPSPDAWRRLEQFSRQWTAARSLLALAIPAVSLEYDVSDPHASPQTAPSVFFSIHPGPCHPRQSSSDSVAGACHTVVKTVLEALGVPSAHADETLDRCCRVLLPRVPFLQFGVWLTRSLTTFRVCAPGLPLSEIRPVVRELGWLGPADAYAARWRDLSSFTDRVSLHLDVGERVGPRLGVEVGFAEASAAFDPHDPDDTRFCDYLVNTGLCLPEKRDALFNWVGGFRLRSPADADSSDLFLRTISHIKLVYQPYRAPQAKAYLAVGYVPSGIEH
ncbi:MAG: hypothetical protein ABIX28_21290 [Vicinamibacterales bacterium]